MPRVALLTLIAAAALGGCATGTKQKANDYVKAVNAAQTSFADDSARLLARVRGGVPTERTTRTIRRFYAAVDGLESRLRDIRPPAAVRRLHRKLIAATDLLGRRLRSAGADITSDDAGRIIEGQQRVTRAVDVFNRSIDSATAAINEALGR